MTPPRDIDKMGRMWSYLEECTDTLCKWISSRMTPTVCRCEVDCLTSCSSKVDAIHHLKQRSIHGLHKQNTWWHLGISVSAPLRLRQSLELASKTLSKSKYQENYCSHIAPLLIFRRGFRAIQVGYKVLARFHSFHKKKIHFRLRGWHTKIINPPHSLLLKLRVR